MSSFLVFQSMFDRGHRKFFKKEQAIFVMDDANNRYAWTAPNSCVWNAPDFLDVRYVLAADDDFGNSKILKRLFTSVLEIGDADWSLYLDQLAEDTNCKLEEYDVSRPSSIYRALWRDVTDSDEWDEIRYAAHSTRYDCTF